MNLRLIPLLIIGFLGQIAQAQTPQLQPLTTFGTNGDGSILPGQRPYLTDGSTNPVVGSGGVHELQRSMAYNPTTGHLLILSRTNTATLESYYVAIIDAATGADVGSLSLGTPGIGGNVNFDFNTIAVADDGGIYICDQTSSSQTSGRFNLYYWSLESGSMNFVWSGDPSSGNISGGNARWGDSMTVSGTGTDTKVLVSSRGNVVAILTPTDPTLTSPWACATILTTVPNGNIGFALAYGVAANTFYAQTANGPLYLFNYTWTNSLAQAVAPTPVMAGAATNIQTYAITSFPQWTGAIGIQSQSNLLAGLEMPPGPAANVRLYGISNTAIPPVLLDRKAWVTNESGNGVFAGSVFFVNTKFYTNVYALNSDNGIMAYSIVSGPTPQVAPAILLNPIAETASLANNAAPLIGAADGSTPLAYQWYFNTNTLIPNATNSTLTVSNVQPVNFGSYYFIVTNGYGSATSAVANLSEAVTFKNGVVYEPFNYTVGLPLQNLGGWVTNTASVAAQVQGCYIAAGSLSAPGLPAPIGNHYLWASNVTVRLPFGSQTNGPLYFSFLHRGTNIGANTATEDPIGGPAYNSGTTLYPKVDCVWSDASHYSVGVAKGTGVGFRVTDTQVFSASDSVFIVCCLIMTNGNTGSDVAELWVNPDPATFGAAAPPVPNCVTNAGNGGATADPASGIDRISWRGTANSFQHEIDEVRIGFTWAAVTPPTPVSLTVSASGNDVVVSWPTSAVGWTLSGTTNLTSGPWSTKTPIVVQGTNNTFTVTGAAGQQFFRLTR
jgi:hypothetical protein